MGKNRMFGRIPFGTEVYLERQGGSRSAELQDISLQGARVGCEPPLPWTPGTFCRLLIPLGEKVRLRFEAEVVHSHEGLAGLKFDRMDPETFSHLVRLLELNTGDAERVEEELRGLVRRSQEKNPSGVS
jgi:hypothetical protein